jgi:hypothetical protein
MALAAATLGLAVAGPAQSQPAAADSAASHDIPPSLAAEHEQTVETLQALSKRPGEVGAVAGQALALYQAHAARERAYILPPLTLLPEIADGKVTPDMRWALTMADRVKADREEIFAEHTKVTDTANALAAAAQRNHDAAAEDFAKGWVADSLNDIEILEPTVLLIGDYLRAKLPPAQ